MFTGIIETLGEVVKLEKEDTNLHLHIKSNLTNELKIDQSVAHNGICLTVVGIQEDTYVVTAIKESLDRTNLNDLKIGSKVNIERCTKIGARLDGHIVQGHVDTVGVCRSIVNANGSWEFGFAYDTKDVTVEKGSITINGTSLTVVDSDEGHFTVAIIPYTYDNTLFGLLKIGDRVNLEFDIVGKYVAKLMAQRG